MKLLGTVKIDTPRLILRKINYSDAYDMFYNWTSDDEVTKYLTWPTHKTIDNTKDIIRVWVDQYNSPFFYHWAIELIENKQVIGTISLLNIDKKNRSCEIGYCMGKKFWNRGLMTEACHFIFEYIFNQLNFEVVFAKHHIDNSASGRVMEKNKMEFVETKTEFSKKENKEIKLKFYRIRKEDYNETNIMEC